MSRLVDDPSKVGPGTYLVNEDQIKKSPKSTINWANSRSIRSGILPNTKTQPNVGPGAYTQSNLHFKPMQPFIPREGAHAKNKTRNNKGCIRDNYEENSDEEDDKKSSPGPGHYMTQQQLSTFKTRARPQSLQFFGSNVKRFNDKPLGTDLGPG